MSIEIQAVVFDMDGLMFNTEDLYDQVGQQLLERRGQRFTRELKMQMMGLPGTKAFEVMIEQCELNDTADQLQSECDELFVDLLPDQIAMMPGLADLMDFLEQKGLPKAVATSSHQQFANRALGMFNLGPRFDFVLTSEDVQNGKPHPEVYQLAAKRLNVEPTQMLVLEDSLTGSRAASASGAFTVAVPTLHSQGCDFSHVDLVVSSLESESLYGIFGKSL